MAINGILGEMANVVDESLFTDDLAIYIITRNQRVVSRALQGVTNKLDAWAAERGLTSYTNKIISMIFIFMKRRKRNEEPIEIMLKNKIIPLKESTQFLGMTLDSKLNWEVHIVRIRAKAKRALNTIKVVAGK